MKTRQLLSLAPSTALLVACGGGGESITAGIDAGGKDGRVGIVSKGRISRFGSVVVNGIVFDTAGATFTIDGAAGSESDLAVGQIVVVRGTIEEDGTNATAETVVYDDVVEGPIGAIDVSGNKLTVLGQTVVIDSETSFDDDIDTGSISGLAAGDVVEISGFVDANGNIVASHIGLEAAGGDFDVTGVVDNVDSAAFTFEINDLLVDYSSATLDGFPNGQPENGQTVEATGTIGGNGELVATTVEFEDGDLGFEDGDEAEISGLITRFASASDFDVDGVPVTTDASTEFEGGTSADLALNRRVEVEGVVNASGVLVADSIEFEQEGDLEISGLIESVGSDSITVFDVTISVTAKTIFDDQSGEDLPQFDLTDLSIGDYVDVNAFDSAGTIVATRIERDDDGGEVNLSGIVEAVDEPQFTIIGIDVSTDSETEFEIDGSEVGAGEFFAQALNRFAEVSGTWNGLAIEADEVGIEEEFDSDDDADNDDDDDDDDDGDGDGQGG